MLPADTRIPLTLSRGSVGQLLDGLEVLVEQWECTAAYFRHGEVGEYAIRECSGEGEATSIAERYREISIEIRHQLPKA